MTQGSKQRLPTEKKKHCNGKSTIYEFIAYYKFIAYLWIFHVNAHIIGGWAPASRVSLPEGSVPLEVQKPFINSRFCGYPADLPGVSQLPAAPGAFRT